jgi:ribosomal protein L11 methyltransferase
MAEPAPLFAARLCVPAGAVLATQDVLCGSENPAPLAVTAAEIDGGNWEISAFYAAAPEPEAVAAQIAPVAEAFAFPLSMPRVEPLPERDWVAESQRGLVPVRAGRYAIVTSQHRAGTHAPIRLVIDAGQAFGTGHHQTTQTCLEALDWLAHRRRFARPLDIGCGSGVLAMAAAATWRVPVLASDIDPRAAATAHDNARRNGLTGLVSVVVAAGFAHPMIRARAPYDLILANILAQPLIDLAPELVRSLAAEGVAVLSGLLAHQQAAVLATYRAHGLSLQRRFSSGAWPTLVLSRGLARRNEPA